jgi:RimJ/RimL family protein N-acetyltransferase
VSLVRRSNAASARVAERLGMTITGSVTFAGFAHDVWEIRPTA